MQQSAPKQHQLVAALRQLALLLPRRCLAESSSSSSPPASSPPSVEQQRRPRRQSPAAAAAAASDAAAATAAASPDGVRSSRLLTNSLMGLGSWKTRINYPILEQQSMRQGKLVPRITCQYVGSCTAQGRRQYQEDRLVYKDLQENLLFVGIFDGHGDAAAADFLVERLPDLVHFWCRQQPRLNVALRRSFVEANNLFQRCLQRRTSGHAGRFASGSTATVCLLRNSTELAVANVGDSKAVLCRSGRPELLSVDHDPALEEEQARIHARGGVVTSNSLGNPVVNGRLSMTRSIGDCEMKPFGVTARPHLRCLEVRHGRDAFLLLVTDGVGFVMSVKEMVDIASTCATPQEAAEILVDQAMQFGSEDNTTAVILPFGSWGKYAKQVGCMPYSMGRNFLANRFTSS